MPEMISLIDEDLLILKKIIRRWIYIVLVSSLLSVISISLAYSEPSNRVVDILLIFQLGIVVVVIWHFLRVQNVIKELRHREELRRHA